MRTTSCSNILNIIFKLSFIICNPGTSQRTATSKNGKLILQFKFPNRLKKFLDVESEILSIETFLSADKNFTV